MSLFRKQRVLEIHGGAVICLLTNRSFDRPNQALSKVVEIEFAKLKDSSFAEEAKNMYANSRCHLLNFRHTLFFWQA